MIPSSLGRSLLARYFTGGMVKLNKYLIGCVITHPGFLWIRRQANTIYDPSFCPSLYFFDSLHLSVTLGNIAYLWSPFSCLVRKMFTSSMENGDKYEGNKPVEDKIFYKQQKRPLGLSCNEATVIPRDPFFLR